MAHVMKVVEGQPVGVPMGRPATVTLESGHVVGCAHWSDADMIDLVGLHPVVNGYDPQRHVATGGGTLAEGGVAAAYVERPIADLQAEAIAALKAECSRRILVTWPDYKQRSAALGVYGVAGAAACKAWIADHIAACDMAEEAILASKTLSELEALPDTEWP